MTTAQKIIKYLAIAFAIFLCASIVGGIMRAVGLLGGLFGDELVADEITTYNVNSEIDGINIKINAADLQIKQGEKFLVESNLKNLKIEEKGGVLILKETKSLASTYTGAVLTVYIPSDAKLYSVDLTTGAGRVSADRLSTKKINFELGAGEVIIGELTAALEADIDGGAGEITISGGKLNGLDFNMGVGRLNFTAQLTGECEFDLGIGESNITLLGGKDDYRLHIEKGLGSITLNGENTSSIKGYGNGANRIEINGGIGAINVEFKTAQQESLVSFD